MHYAFRNFVWSFLSSEVLEADTELPVDDVSRFPTLDYSVEQFMMTLHDGEQEPELVMLAGVGTTSITVVRAQEETTAKIWPIGTKVFNSVTAAMLDETRYPEALASNITFEPDPGSEFSATNVQDALEELEADINVVETDVSAIEADITAITAELLTLPATYAPLSTLTLRLTSLTSPRRSMIESMLCWSRAPTSPSPTTTLQGL